MKQLFTQLLYMFFYMSDNSLTPIDRMSFLRRHRLLMDVVTGWEENLKQN